MNKSAKFILMTIKLAITSKGRDRRTILVGTKTRIELGY